MMLLAFGDTASPCSCAHGQLTYTHLPAGKLILLTFAHVFMNALTAQSDIKGSRPKGSVNAPNCTYVVLLREHKQARRFIADVIR